MKKALLLDVSAIMYRAYFSLINMSNSKGQATGAIYGFTNTLLALIEEYEPDYIISAFDNKRSNLKRTEIFSAYKAQRKPMPEDLLEQVEKIEKLLDGFGINRYRVDGYEADDVLGTLAKKFSEMGVYSYVVTGDKDLSQIINENISIALLGKGTGKSKTKLVSNDLDVIEQLGVVPSLIPDLFGLIGDTSDGIPGIRKVGEKKAVPLLEKFGNLEGIYENLDKLTDVPGIGKGLIQNIIEDKEIAFLSRELAIINQNIDIDFKLEDGIYTKNNALLYKLFEECEMFSFIKKLSLKKEEISNQLSFNQEMIMKPEEKIELEKIIVKDDLTFEKLKSIFNGEKVFLYENKYGYVIGNIRKVFYVPTYHQNIGIRNFEIDLLKEFFSNSNSKIITYNAKDILKKMPLNNLFFDIYIANYLITANTKDDFFTIVERVTGENISKEILDKEENYINLNDFAEFSFSCFENLLNVYFDFEKRLKTQNLEKLYFEIELPLVKVLSSMEKNGVKINVPFFKEYEIELSNRINDLVPSIYNEFLNKVKFNLEMVIISEMNIREFYTEIGKLMYKKKSDMSMFLDSYVNVSNDELLKKPLEFNIASPKQLGIVLFDLMNLPTLIKTKTGYSVNEEVLEDLKYKGEKIAEYLLEYRKLTKLLNTYVEALPKLIDKDSRIHTTFNQTGTTTGRLSSSDPNLQNIPARSDDGIKIREGFISRDGFTLASFDYSQIELRVLASVSEDENLIKAYNNDLDLHDLTARKIFELDETNEVTREMRSVAKIVNFSIIYGKTAFGLAKELNISQSEAKSYIEKYFAQYPKVKELEINIINSATEKGYVETIYGRKRDIPELKSKNKNLKNAGERMAVNTVIQGSAADILKIVMVKLFKEFQNDSNIYMNLQVHDELLFEIKNDKIDEYLERIKSIMENSVELPKVMLKVNGNSGENWSQIK